MPCLPSPTPSDEDPEHFAPPGYAYVTEFFQAPMDALPPTNLQPETKKEEIEVAAPARALQAIPDLNLPAPEKEDAAPSRSPSTPSPEACVLLRRFASAMAAHPIGIRAGTWSPVELGLRDRFGALRLDDLPEGTSRR